MNEMQPAEWYGDPLGHAQLRYWDGERWTDHVVNDGEQAIDPLVGSPTPPEPAGIEADEAPAVADGTGIRKAGFYADPLGHADQRYWDGDRWTEHVTTGGRPANDPLGGTPTPVVPVPMGAAPPAASDWIPDVVPVAAPPANESTSRRRKLPLAFGGLALAAMVVGVVLLVSGGDEDGDGQQAGVVQALLESADSLGPEPFMPEFAAEPVISIPENLVLPTATTVVSTTIGVSTSTSGPPDTQEPTTTVVATATTVALGERVNYISGGTPGLYGGTQDNTRCDPIQLVDFLEANPQKAEAWVAAMNEDPSTNWFSSEKLLPGDIAGFVGELTPVVLLNDTLVVNNGFSGGQPSPRNAVLQKGSAVMVDPFGVPRTRCACGNPLAQPPPGISQVEPTGDPWPGFSTSKVSVVEALPAGLRFFSLRDIQTGAEFERPMGTKGERDVPTTTVAPPTTPAPTTTLAPTTLAPTTVAPTTTVVLGTGDVQATLNWSTDADLDLHVIGPDEFEISYMNPESDSGGTLDVDRVPAIGDAGPHVENVFWPTGAAPPGSYQVWVLHFDGSASDYSLTVKKDGQIIHQETGTLQPGAESTRFSFTN